MATLLLHNPVLLLFVLCRTNNVYTMGITTVLPGKLDRSSRTAHMLITNVRAC